MVESEGVIREFCKLFLTSAAYAAVWLFFIRTELISFGSLEIGQVMVFGIVLPLTAIITIFFGATQIKSAGRYLKEWGRLDPDVWPVHWAAHFWCVFYAFDRVGSFTNVKSLRY